MRGLRQQLVDLDDGEVGEPAEVGLVAPDPLIAGHHRVVVRRLVLIVDVVAVHRDAVARLPVAHRGADAQHDTGGIAADDLVRLIVALGPLALATESRQRAERADRLEDGASTPC